jgi:hypothetical protein
MRSAPVIIRSLVFLIFTIMVLPAGIAAQSYEEPVQGLQGTAQADRFTVEELTQMLAPIALYPDSLIVQILMASTYPLEVVEAERWVRANPELKGDELNNALLDKPWDPSIKALCHFPDVLFAMSDKLDQTRKLGDAFLEQQDDVMATIQELRRRAEEQGNLRTTSEQKVVVEREVIRIEPANPQVVYVPVYNPLYVYGPWWYPAYPPYYWYYPPTFVVSGGHIVFGPRIFIGFGLFSWSWFDWHRHTIFIDVRRTNRFHRHRIDRDFDRPFHWRHDPRHRRGVAYRDIRTGERFGQRPLRRQAITPESRGFPPGGVERRAVSPFRSPAEPRERTGQPGVRPSPERVPRSVTRDTPFRGVGEGRFEHRAGERGRDSRSGSAVTGPGREIRQPDGGRLRQQAPSGPAGGIRQPDGGQIRQQRTPPDSGGGIRQPGGGSPGRGGSDGFRRSR